MRALPLCSGGADLAPQPTLVRRWECDVRRTAGAVIHKDLCEGIQEKDWYSAGLQGGFAE